MRKDGFDPRTIGKNEYGKLAPLEKIRKTMDECHGLLAVALRRAYIEKGTGKPDANLKRHTPYDISKSWITSPFCQIEPSIAFQKEMPILIFREEGVIADGILENGIVGSYMPEPFNLDSSTSGYFSSLEWVQLISEWKTDVVEYEKK